MVRTPSFRPPAQSISLDQQLRAGELLKLDVPFQQDLFPIVDHLGEIGLNPKRWLSIAKQETNGPCEREPSVCSVRNGLPGWISSIAADHRYWTFCSSSSERNTKGGASTATGVFSSAQPAQEREGLPVDSLKAMLGVKARPSEGGLKLKSLHHRLRFRKARCLAPVGPSSAPGSSNPRLDADPAGPGSWS